MAAARAVADFGLSSQFQAMVRMVVQQDDHKIILKTMWIIHIFREVEHANSHLWLTSLNP